MLHMTKPPQNNSPDAPATTPTTDVAAGESTNTTASANPHDQATGPTEQDRDPVLYRFPDSNSAEARHRARLARIREELIAGTFDLDTRMEQAVDRLWMDLTSEDPND